MGDTGTFNWNERLTRIEDEIDELETRLRTVENLDAPAQRRTVERIEQLSRRVEIMRELDTNTKVDNALAAIREIRDDLKATRTLVKSALFSGLTAIVVQIIAAAILYAVFHTKGPG